MIAWIKRIFTPRAYAASLIARDLDQRLAVRRANRAKPSESARNGHSTRWQKAGAKCREMFHGNLEL